jgi:hypothetical protein
LENLLCILAAVVIPTLGASNMELIAIKIGKGKYIYASDVEAFKGTIFEQYIKTHDEE